MSYKHNPKTKGSGIICCIPQTGECPQRCDDCFFQSGRSYLEPLDENLPNMPAAHAMIDRIIRVNDGNDSNVDREIVIERTQGFPHKFYNTSIQVDLDSFPGPVVLTINPGVLTDGGFCAPIGEKERPPNLMFIRIRTNTWNLDAVDAVVRTCTDHEVPVVLTFMAYFTEQIPELYRVFCAPDYILRKRTMNDYWAITTTAWERVMSRYKHNKWVSSCGKIEGERGTTACRFCGVCLREYFATMERMREASNLSERQRMREG